MKGKTKSYRKLLEEEYKKAGTDFPLQEWNDLMKKARKLAPFGMRYSEEVYNYFKDRQNIIKDWEDLHVGSKHGILKRFEHFEASRGTEEITNSDALKLPNSIKDALVKEHNSYLYEFYKKNGLYALYPNAKADNFEAFLNKQDKSITIQDIFDLYRKGKISYYAFESFIRDWKESYEKDVTHDGSL